MTTLKIDKDELVERFLIVVMKATLSIVYPIIAFLTGIFGVDRDDDEA